MDRSELEHAANLNSLYRFGKPGGEQFKLVNHHTSYESYEGLDFTSASFTGCVFKGMTFKDTLFSNAVVRGCHFTNCHFDNTSFRQVDLTATRFDTCKFDLTNFAYARMYGTHIERSTMYWIDFKSADLTNAVLRYTDLHRTCLEATKGVLRIGPIGSRGDSLWVIMHTAELPEKLMFKTGCFWGPLEQLQEEVDNQYAPDDQHYLEYKAAIEMALAWRDSFDEEASDEND
jgi:hypothetical protein